MILPSHILDDSSTILEIVPLLDLQTSINIPTYYVPSRSKTQKCGDYAENFGIQKNAHSDVQKSFKYILKSQSKPENVTPMKECIFYVFETLNCVR